MKSAYMVKPIWTAILHDLSNYLNEKYPGEKFAVMMDNAKMHDIIVELPHQNMEFIKLPPNTTGYLQAADALFNAVFKLKFKLLMEDYLLDLHFENQKVKCNDEQGSRMATQAFNEIPKSIIKERV